MPSGRVQISHLLLMYSMPLHALLAIQSCLHSSSEFTLATVKYSRALSVGVLPRQTRSTPPSTGSNISVSVVEVVGSVVIVAVVAAVVLAVVAGVVVTLAVELTVVSTIDFHLPLQDASQLDFDWSQ